MRLDLLERFVLVSMLKPSVGSVVMEQSQTRPLGPEMMRCVTRLAGFDRATYVL